MRARRRQLKSYLAVVLLTSLPLEIWLILHPNGALSLLGVGVLMWIPGLVAIAQRKLERTSIRELGFRTGPRQFWAIAYLLPAACAAVAYTIAALSRVISYAPLPEQDVGSSVFFQVTIGVFVGAALALGEELGWRGHLLPRLIEAELPAPLWLAAAARAVWYAPLAVAQSGLLVAAGVPLFLIAATLSGVFAGWLRLASGSIWPPVIALSVHNVAYQSVFGPLFEGRLEPLFAGEAGVISIAAYALIVVWLWRTKRT